MLEVEPVRADGCALAALARAAGAAGAAGAALEGLRLAGGSLILKLERGGRAQQIRLADGDAFDPRARYHRGAVAPGSGMAGGPRAQRRAVEAAAGAGPSDGAGSGAGDRDLLMALDLERAGRSQPEIAAAAMGSRGARGPVGWASTVHAFQGRTVDTAIAAIEANHPNLTNQKMLYVEISRARDRAELVTDDKAGLKEQLEALTRRADRGARGAGRGEGEGPGGCAGARKGCGKRDGDAGADDRAGAGEGSRAEGHGTGIHVVGSLPGLSIDSRRPWLRPGSSPSSDGLDYLPHLCERRDGRRAYRAVPAATASTRNGPALRNSPTRRRRRQRRTPGTSASDIASRTRSACPDSRCLAKMCRMCHFTVVTLRPVPAAMSRADLPSTSDAAT